MHPCRTLWTVLSLFAASIISAAGPAGSEQVRHHFSASDGHYSFTAEFTLPADRQCLMQMLYDPEQLRQYARHADAVELVDQGENWQSLTYEYNRLFHHSRSTFKRIRRPGSHRIDYHLIALEQQGIFTPEIRSITGYYLVSREEAGVRVTFYQQGTIESGMFNSLYVNTAKKEALEFVGNMQNHAASHCRQSENISFGSRTR